jgi:hypothetical protein
MIYDAIKRRDNLIAGQVDSIALIGKAGGESLTADAERTAGEVAAFKAVLAYINNGWQAE